MNGHTQFKPVFKGKLLIYISYIYITYIKYLFR